MAEDKKKISEKTLDQLDEQSNLMKSMAKLAKNLGLEYEKHSQSIGSTVKDLTKMEKLQSNIKTVSERRNSLELNMVKRLEQTVRLESDLLKNASLKEKISKKIGELTAREIEARREGMDDEAKKLVEKVKVLKKEEGKREELLKTLKRSKDLHINMLGLSKSRLDIEDKVLKSLKKREDDEKNRENLEKKSKELKDKALDKLKSIHTQFFTIFTDIDSSMFSIRKHFGLFADDSKDVENTAIKLNKDFQSMGVSIEVGANSVKSVADNFTRISTASDNTYKNIALFSSQFGIAERISSDVFKNLAGISGGLLKDVSNGMMGFAAELSAASGTNLNEVMSDIANMSESIRATFRGSTQELIKTTVEARRMGLSLDSIARSSEGLLDFNSSVNAEMEASVLLGKNLNLNEVRRLSFQGKIGEASKEILRVVKSAGDFDKMNMMQRKALAQAVGMSMEDLQKMVTLDKEITFIEKSGTEQQKKALAVYREKLKLSEKENLTAGERFEKRMTEQANQEKMTQLTNQLKSIWLEMGDSVINDFIRPLLNFATKTLPAIINHMKEHSFIWKSIGVLLAAASFTLSTLIPTFISIKSLMLFFPKTATLISSVFSSIGSFLLSIGTWLLTSTSGLILLTAAIGAAIGRLLYMWTPIQEAADTFAEWLFEKWEMVCDDLLGGLMSVREDILDAIVWPFANAYEWLRKKWLGNSPSEIGLRIVDGIASIGKTLVSYLTSPFTSAFTFITELFGKIPEFITGVFKRGFDFVTKLPGMGLLTKAIDTFSGNKPAEVNQKIEPVQAKADDQKIEPVQAKADDTNRLILEKLTELTNLMRSGGIAINMDGRRVSEALAHASSR